MLQVAASAMRYIRVITLPASSDHTPARANVHARALKPDSTPLQNTTKLLVWAGSTIQTFGTKPIEEVIQLEV